VNSASLRRPHVAAALLGAWAAAIAVIPGVARQAIVAAPAAALAVAWWTLRKPHRWLTLFFCMALLLPPLPIAAGDSGPHPCLAAAALGLFAGALWLPRWRIALNSVSFSLAALLFALLLSVPQAVLRSGFVPAAASLARVALFGIPVYIFFYAAYGPGKDASVSRFVRLLYWFAIVSALFACVDFYYQFPAPAGYGPQFVWLDSGVYRRAQGLFYEASTLGNFCAFFLVMILVALSRPSAESPVSRPGLCAGGAVLLAALVLSYSRASLITVAVAALVLLWINRRRIRFTHILVTFSSALAGAALIWKLFPAFAEMYWVRLSGSAEFLFTATNGVLSGRVESWRTLTSWIAAHPGSILLGIGYKTLPYSDAAGGPIVADNMYLSLLIETGIFGLLALIWFNSAVLRASWKASRSAVAQRSFLGAWMLCFWCGEAIQMFSGDILTYWRVLPVYFWVLAAAVRE